MSTAVATQQTAGRVEQVLVQGDLSRLTEPERVTYYQRVCESLGLNPLTRPFDYLTLNGKLQLYARKDAADQLRRVHGISIDKPKVEFEGDYIIVTVTATDASGRTDSDVGAVKKTDMRGDFGNALMKAVTKAKRRVTLSICGLGMLDETEVETIPDARTHEPPSLPAPQPVPQQHPAPAKPANGNAGPRKLPATGAELHARLSAYEAKLVKEGVIKPGELIAHLVDTAQDWPADLKEWDRPEQIRWACEEVQMVEQEWRQEAAQPQ